MADANEIRALKASLLGALESARALEAIERSALAQAQLIDDLLDISRIVSGKLKLEVLPVDLNAVVEQSIDRWPASLCIAAPLIAHFKLCAAGDGQLNGFSSSPGRRNQRSPSMKCQRSIARFFQPPTAAILDRSSVFDYSENSANRRKQTP